MSVRRNWLSLTMILWLSACAGSIESDRIENPAVELLYAPEMPPPLLDGMPMAIRPTYLGPGDELSIEVFGVEELSRQLRVDGAGSIAYPLIGELQAAGLTRDELAEQIESGLRGRYVRDPEVTVNVTEAASRTFAVDGGVESPGSYPIAGDMTLMRAIASAGGLNTNAKTEDVVIFRTVNGQKLMGLYNLGGIRVGNYDDPKVYSNDIIVVNSKDPMLGGLFQALSATLPVFLIADRITRRR